MRLILFLLLSVPTTLFAQSRSYPPTIDGGRVEIYKRVGDTNLRLWVLEPSDHRPSDSRPAIVFFFGGGWKSGSPTQFEQHCRYFAAEGMLAITADYRVRQRHGTLADRSVSDAKSAVRWIRQHADRLGIDPQRIVASGGSAGGHLAACTALIQELDDPSESSETSSTANALALFNPALVLAPYEGVSLADEKLADLAARTGVDPKRISPIHHVRPGLPPTILFHGEEDTTVPLATIKRYAEVATAAGNRCEFVAYRDAGHGFFNFGRDGNPGEFYPATIHRLHRFLHSLGYLDTAPSIAVPKSENVHLRSHFDHSRRMLQTQRKGTVAFIGGSITEMKGYRLMVEQTLRTRFPEADLQFINAGISSTCSTTGAFRLSRDVLSADPDLLFVEFAVNDDQDAAHAARECSRGMEGILRQARKHNRKMDIVVTHFVNPPMLELLQRDETPLSSGTHERVARHYGVSTVDLAREVAQRINSRRLTWTQYGGTHPAEQGNRIAAEMIEDLLSTAWSSAPAENPSEHRLPRPLDPCSYFDGRLVDIADAKKGEHWTLQRPDWSNINGALRPRFKDDRLLCASDVGAEVTLPFNGRAVGVYLLAGPDAGSIEYSIDGGAFESVDVYHRFSKGLHYPRTVLLRADLQPREHQLTLRVGTFRNQDSTGHAIRILNFVVN